MLVYANRLRVQGADAEWAVFKAIGGWLKEQLGFGIHPDRLKQDGEYRGHRQGTPSWLRIHGCYDGEPALCAWVLKHGAEDVRGRQWIVEVGVKNSIGTLEVSCVVKTDEQNTLVSSPVSASQPRVVRYIAENVFYAKDAEFVDDVPGEFSREIGRDRDSYRAFRAEIERRDRDGAIVLVSPTSEGDYLVNPTTLQSILIGLAQVVQVVPRSNSYEMTEILGKPWSAWNGSVNILYIPVGIGQRAVPVLPPRQDPGVGRGTPAPFVDPGLGHCEHQHSALTDACTARGRQTAFHAATYGADARNPRPDER